MCVDPSCSKASKLILLTNLIWFYCEWFTHVETAEHKALVLITMKHV